MAHAELNILIEKLLNNSIQQEELQQLRQLLRGTDKDEALDELIGNILLQSRYDIIYEADKDALFKQIRQSEGIESATDTPVSSPLTISRKIHFLKTTWFRYAAAVILIVGVGGYLWFHNTISHSINHESAKFTIADIPPGSNRATLTLADGSKIILDSVHGNIMQQSNLKVMNVAGKLDYEGIGSIAETHTLSTPKGGQYQLVLPDGSKVWLNALSSITYPTAFVGKDRKVSIVGEAFFEIAKDKEKPFIVQANNEKITVLGTSFNVNAYKDESVVRTSLLEGAVTINGRILKPGEAYCNGEIMKANLEQELAWKEGLFNFEGADFPQVMRQLERWYDIQVKYEGKIPEGKFGGKLPRNLNLSQVTRILKDMKVNSRIEGRTLFIQ